MAHKEAINDIGNALLALRDAFEVHGIPVPDTLRWSDLKRADEAQKVLRSIPAPGLGMSHYRIDVGGRPVLGIAGFVLE
jgi:hypothetical protein